MKPLTAEEIEHELGHRRIQPKQLFIPLFEHEGWVYNSREWKKRYYEVYNSNIPLSKHEKIVQELKKANAEVEVQSKLLKGYEWRRKKQNQEIEEKNKLLSRINSIQAKAEKGCGKWSIGSPSVVCGGTYSVGKMMCDSCKLIIATCKRIKNEVEK